MRGYAWWCMAVHGGAWRRPSVDERGRAYSLPTPPSPTLAGTAQGPAARRESEYKMGMIVFTFFLKLMSVCRDRRRRERWASC